MFIIPMEIDFRKELNTDQQKAVVQTEGPMIILAGAGSGKTRCITYKVLYLLEKGINPYHILCVTFTNKTAAEMKNRIQQFLREHTISDGQPTVATFHSLCAKILRIEGKHLDISSKFAIYDPQDQIEAIKEAMQKLSISLKDFKPSSILATISQAKNELLTSSDYKNLARGHFQSTAASIYPLYQQILKENHALDFDDLIFYTTILFEKFPEILEKYQDKFQYILVDEYQDTNRAQYYLTKLLSKKRKNICVVGDFSQSIYSWRGADFRNLAKFKEDFPNAITFSLNQNYLSTQNILDAAYSVVSKNTSHPVLSLWTKNPKGDNIVIHEARDEQKEALYIIRSLQSSITP